MELGCKVRLSFGSSERTLVTAQHTSFDINFDTTVKLCTIVIRNISQRCNAYNYLALTSSKIHKLNQSTDTYLTIQKSHKNVVLTPGVIHSPWRLTY